MSKSPRTTSRYAPTFDRRMLRAGARGRLIALFVLVALGASAAAAFSTGSLASSANALLTAALNPQEQDSRRRQDREPGGEGANPARRASDAHLSRQAQDSDATNADEADEVRAERYIVRFRQYGAGARAAVRDEGGQVLVEIPQRRALAARMTEQAMRRLERDPNVEYIEVDQVRYPMAGGPPWNEISANGEITPYGIQMVQADQLTDAAAGNRTVCIIDSGYYRAHDDLQHGRVTASPDMGTGDPFVDRSGHGTHVAGTIAGIGGNGIGVRGVMQSQNINLHIVKVFGDDGAWAYSSTLINALTQCRNAGANVVNMSLGGAGSSTLERDAFQAAFDAGVLSIAAAGNGGNTALSYPASYDSVVSIGGVDRNEALYTSSQRNSQVELAAPAVDVLSTVPYGEENTLTVGGITYRGNSVEFAARSNGVTGTLVDGGVCDTPNASWNGNIVLCERGVVSFFVKVNNAQNSGATAAVIYNNIPGGLSATLGAGNTSTIPAIGLSQADGQAALSGVGSTSTVVSKPPQVPATFGYSSFNGTSMATPHVAGVAALIWSYNPSWTNAQIRQALQVTARDIGDPGRDNSFGFGIIQAKGALDYLCLTTGAGCSAPSTPTPAPTSGCFADTSEGDFYTGNGANINVTANPGNARLVSTGDLTLDQQDTTASTGGFGFNATNWFAQTFTAGNTGQLTRVDLNLFCANGCTGANPNITVSIRATSGDLPTGPDLATATIPGFSSAAGGWYAANFATPANLTAGTRYAIVARPVANRIGLYAYVTAPAGQDNTYAAGRRATSANSGGAWTGQVRDVNFKTYTTGIPPHTYAAAGTLVSAIKDSNPPSGNTVSWGNLDWTADTPAGTSISFQVAASNNAGGPFNFVGPDGTSATFFTTGGASLEQFAGYRYLRYQAFFSTSDPSVTPTLNDVSLCFSTQTPATITLSNLHHIYDGTPKSATVTTNPAGLSVRVTYDGSEEAPTAPGSYAVVASVTEPGYVATDATGTLVIEDNAAPTIAGVSVDKPVLSPPNHQMVDINVAYTATDNTGVAPTVTLSVSSNEPTNGRGDGNTSYDWQVVNNRLVRLRAERAGTGNGRIYTITITATDGSGNTTTRTVTVTVPKNQS